MPKPLDDATVIVEQFCANRVPEHARDEFRLECSRRGNSITISECRPPWNPAVGSGWSSLKVAQLRYEADAWTLYCRDRNERWFESIDIAPSRSIEPLLEEIDSDPTGIFWG